MEAYILDGTLIKHHKIKNKTTIQQDYVYTEYTLRLFL